MKNFLRIALAFTLLSFTITSSAQSTYPGMPMFGTAPNQNNTGSVLTYGYVTISDTLGATTDTVTIIPKHYQKYYLLTLKDSCVLSIKNVGSSFTGDRMQIWISAPSNACFVNFLGYSGLVSQWKMTGGTTKISPTQGHWWVGNFVCTGTAWIEESSSQD